MIPRSREARDTRHGDILITEGGEILAALAGMSKRQLDADAILDRAKPVIHQQAHEIHPYGHLVKLPIALAENVCKESVENLNQLLADTITLRDLTARHAAALPLTCASGVPAARGEDPGDCRDFA